MAFLCPVRIRRSKKKHGGHQLESDLLTSNALSRQPLPNMGRITGSASIETLVRVGIEKEHGLSPDSKMIVLHDFMPCVDDELEVHRGQVVNVLYQENDWVYVISENQQHEGFIPYSYCAPLESHLDNMLTYKKKMPRSHGPGSVNASATTAEGVSINVNDDGSSLMNIASHNMLNGASDGGVLKISNHSNGSNFDGGTSGVGTAVTGDNDGLSSYLMPNINSDLTGGGVGEPISLAHSNGHASNHSAIVMANNDFGSSQVSGGGVRATTPHNSGSNYQLESVSQMNYNSMLNIDTVSCNPSANNNNNIGITGGGSCVGAAPSIISACSNGARSNLSNHHSKKSQNLHFNSNTLNSKVSSSHAGGSVVASLNANSYHHHYGTLNRAKSNSHKQSQKYQQQQSQQQQPTNPANATHSPTSSALRNLDIYFANTYNQMPINLKDGTTARNRLPLFQQQQQQQQSTQPLPPPLGELQPFFKDSSGHYIVLYTFLAREENDVSVERGEVVTVLNKDDPNWFWIVRSDSQEGFVPSIFICPADMLLNVHHSNLQQFIATNNQMHHQHQLSQQLSHSIQPVANIISSGVTAPQNYNPHYHPNQSHSNAAPQHQHSHSSHHHPHHHHRTSSIHFSNQVNPTPDSSNLLTIPTNNNNQTAAIYH